MDSTYDLDTLMGLLGDFGKYQAWQFSLHILSAFMAGLNMMTLVTVAATPDFRCEIPGYDLNKKFTKLNDTILAANYPRSSSGQFDTCSLINSTTNTISKCDSFVWDHTYYGSTKATEWQFVCDRRWMASVAQSVYMLGVLTGGVILGKMADKYGRKPIFCWSAVFQLIFGVLVAFAPEYISFLILRYLYGIFGSAGCYIPGFVLSMELIGPKRRSVCGISFQAAFALGIIFVAGWATRIKDAQLLQVIYGCHALLLVGHIWLMDESPRWLWGNGRIHEAVKIVQKGLRINGSKVNLDAAQFVSKGVSEMRKSDDDAKIGDLFKTPNLRKKTLNVMLCWFANSLAYYGLSLGTNSMAGNPFLNMFIMAAVEMPSYVITIYLLDKWGRRLLTSQQMIFGGLCCFIAANITNIPASLTIIFIGKFLVASSFAIIFNYSAEIFPTVARSSAMGLGAMSARISGALTPLISLLDSFDPKIPSMIFAVISVVSGFLVMFLPETMNKPLPQTIQDGEEFGVGDTMFSALCKKGVNNQREDVPQKVNGEQLEPLK